MTKTDIQILLIEDNPGDVILLREALENDGLSTFTLTNIDRLKAALEIVQKTVFDIILLDLGLPDSQGLETFIRIHQLVPRIPKIILSGLADEAFATQAVHIGAQDYLVKGSADMVSLTRTIRYTIERYQAQTALRSSEARYQQVLDAMLEGCQIIGFDWRYVYINDAAEIHNRRPKGELIGRKYMDMWPNIESTQVFAQIKRCFEKRVSIQMENEFVFPDGTIGIFNLSIQPVPEGVFILSTDITEKKKAADAVRASEERFRAMIENGSDDISLLDPDGTLLWESPAVVRNLGYPPDAFVGRNLFELVHPDDRPWVRDQQAAISQTPGSRVNGSFRLQHSNGSWRWVEVVATNMLDNPSIGAIVINYHDVTKRKQSEEDLRNAREFLQGVQNSLSAHLAILDGDGVIVQVNLAWRKFADQNGLNDSNYGVGSNYLAICDAATGANSEEAAETASKIREVAAGRSTHAQVEYQCHGPDRQRWFILHITRFVTADQSWVVLAHENITKRKQIEEKVRETSEQFRTLFEASPEAILLIDPHDNWSILDCNATGCAMNGYTRAELIGQSVNIFNLTPGDSAERSEYLERIRKEGVLRLESTHRRKDGTIFPIEVSTSLITLGGREVILGIDRDITERKQMETRVQASETRYRLATLASQDVIWEWNADTNQVIWSENTQTVLGYSSAEIDPNVTWWEDHIHPEDRQRLLAKMSAAMDSGESVWSDEYRFQLKDGSYAHISDNGYIEREANGSVIRAIGAMSDISEQKKSEAALRESELRFRTLFEDMPVAIWEEDFSEVKKYLDALKAEGVTNLSEYFAAHPDILAEYSNKMKIINVNNAALKMYRANNKEDLYKSTYAEMSAGEKENILSDFIAIAEGRTSNSWDGSDETLTGEPMKITLTWSVFSGYENDYSKVIVTTIDITERERAEAELRTSEERFRQLSDNVQEAFWITDAASGEDIYISQAAETIWGTPVDTLMNIPDAFVNHILPEDHPKVKQTIERQRSGQRTEVEYRIVRPDGAVRWIWDRAFPIMDDSGKTVRVAGIAADITERKQFEKELERHLAEMEALYENGLAVGRLLNPKEIGERIIETFTRHLAWHHVVIRIKERSSDELKLVAFNHFGLGEPEKNKIEAHLNSAVNRVGQGLSGWVVQTGQAFRTGDVNANANYVGTYSGMQSGLYMPLKAGDMIIGVINVESEEPNAFTEQDERLLATLANQAAIAFENARLYQSVQQELQERKRMETELRNSETHYRELADSITDIFFELDKDLRPLYWNKASELLTGVSAKDAIGKSMSAILGASEEQARIEEAFKNILEKYQPQTLHINFAFNNQIRSFEVNAYPSTHGVSVVAKDVTERKRNETIMQKRFELMEYAGTHALEEIMQKTMDEISQLTSSMAGFFHIIEPDQNSLGLQTWPASTLSLFNVPASEGQHRAVDQAGVWAEAIRQRRPLIQNNYESLPAKKDLPPGHAPIIREMVIPIIRSEKILAVMGIANKPDEYTYQDLDLAERFADYAWDITERKQMEAALAEERNQLANRVDERTIDLSRANANLARALRVKDEFLANMSHELRTPLNAILGLSESLAEQTAGPLNEKQMRYITTVSESGHHLLSLINDILDLAKIEAGQITLDVNKVDIRSVCDASLRMIKQLAQKKNQAVAFEIDKSLELMWADERRLKQMLVNLLSNAVKFTPEGGRLGLEVYGNQDENKITFTIWDTGIGIKDSDMTRLFQPFVQLDAGLARESSGTGLGLALVAQMARMHGGSASVTSEPGKGSRFSIMLPWEPALASDTIERLKTTGKFKPVKFTKDNKPTILLIEDTEEVIMMVADYLESNGFNTVTAHDGLEGILQAQLTHPDLILMDIQMPNMDGFEATKKLRSDPGFKRTPIIALTALAMSNDRERCLEAGMDEYITKPVHLRGLVKIIGNFLGGERKVEHP